jgi:uncharacterized phage-associated protein
MFRTILNDKIGNLLVYLAQNIDPLYMTKALKILYIIDEVSVRQIGVPVTWLEYKVWKLGPVTEEIYNEIRHNKREVYGENIEISLHKYIQVEKTNNPAANQYDSYLIKPKVSFDDAEFSEYEMEIIQKITQICKPLSANELIRKLHQDDTLWDKIVKSERLQRTFELEQNRSNYVIDFTALIQNDLIKSGVYKSAYEAMNFEEELS